MQYNLNSINISFKKLYGCVGRERTQMTIWKKVTAAVAMAGLVASFALTGCGGTQKKDTAAAQKTQVITDVKGNQVTVPKDLKKLAVVPLPWASVVYALDGSSERIAAIHPGAMSAYKGSFFTKVDPHFGKLDSKLVNQNFTPNVEGMAQAGVQACLVWQYQDRDAAKLKQAGIAPVMIYNDTIENLKKSFRIVGKLLGKEDRAEKVIQYYDQSYNSILKHKDEVAKAKKPMILFLRNSKLRLQGNDNFMFEAIKIGGGRNPIDQSAMTNPNSNKELPMEEIYKLNPDIIFLSNFDKFVPDDLYQNRIPGQDWSTIKAVKEHRVYKVPKGIYRWDAPGVETPLMMRWMAYMMQPEIFKDIDIRKETKAFYKDFIHYDASDEDLKQIFADEANHNSVFPGAK